VIIDDPLINIKQKDVILDDPLGPIYLTNELTIKKLNKINTTNKCINKYKNFNFINIYNKFIGV